MLFAEGISWWKQAMPNIWTLMGALKFWNVLKSGKTVQNRRKLLKSENYFTHRQERALENYIEVSATPQDNFFFIEKFILAFKRVVD